MKISSALENKLEQQIQSTELISEEQLQLAKELQGESEISFSDALVELELLSAAELDRILVSLQEIRSVKLEDVQIDLEAVRHVPRRVAVDLKCVPIRRSGNTLVVAAADADEGRVRDGLRNVTDYDIVLLATDIDAIEHALYVYYGDEQVAGSVTSDSVSQRDSSVGMWGLRPAWAQSFETFVLHEGVMQARELAKQIASGEYDAINFPLVLVGPEHSGRTHLLAAIRNYRMAKDPVLKGVFVSGEELKTLYADYKLAGLLDALSYELREASTLLVDDFAGLWGHEEAESWFARSVANMREHGAAIVLSLGQEDQLEGPVSQLLREVLSAGTVIQMQLPSKATLDMVVESRCPSKYAGALRNVLDSCEDGEATWNSLRDFALKTKTILDEHSAT